jgi:hypothetical protein
MKKFISLLIGCSLALAGAALAQQPEEQPSPGKGKKQGAEKPHAAEAQPGAKAPKHEAKPANQTGAMKEHGAAHEHAATSEPGAGKGHKTPAHQESATAPETNVSGQPAATVPPGGKHHAGQHEKGMKAAGANAKTSPAATPVTAATASATSSGAGAGQQNAQAAGAGAVKKADPQKVQQVKAQAQQIRQQHANFRAQPRPDRVPPVTFNESYRIQGSDRWQGSQYEVFRSYRPERHDRGWYSSRYSRVELIGGGYYYWNNNYWYQAWGYDPSAEYYAYDAPIYVGHRAEPPDRVIADVQAELQQMGYYTGEVDGLLGPLTREALTAYQADQGLATTAVIDEPTLDSLGMS